MMVVAVSRDGQRLLMVWESAPRDDAADQSDIVVVENWLEELKRLVPMD